MDMRFLRTQMLVCALLLSGALAGTAQAEALPSSPPPSCAEGPERRGDVTLGTPCDDVILAPPGVAAVRAGGGDDTIVPTPVAAATDCPSGCFLGVGSQTFEGGPGNDVVYGQRGNDRLFGNEGDDRLFGGIGDDLLRGGPGNDRLSGGFGFDAIDGEAGDDLVRGDATVDEILDSGGGVDTLSYATGATPGFTRPTGIAGFPPAGSERGVYLDLGAGLGDNGVAPDGGGVDEIVGGASFERLIGTPFSDYIVGTAAPETIFGGGGADALFGEGGDDTLRGGADGDLLDGGSGTNVEDPGVGDPGTAIGLRDSSKASAGFQAPGQPGLDALHVTGSTGGDQITATYVPGSPDTVVLQLAAATFDQTPPGCVATGSTRLDCPLSGPLEAIVLAGVGGGDILNAVGFPSSTGTLLLGGSGDDFAYGGDLSEDVLVDGAGDDHSDAYGGDDALLNNTGADRLFGGSGNDLFLNDALCEGDLVDGGSERDNASWSKLGEPVDARLEAGIVGRPGDSGPECGGAPLGTLAAIEDLEGSGNDDVLLGDAGRNQLLGRPGADSYFALAGDDLILANSGDVDTWIDCGEGAADMALVDRPPIADPAPVGCEAVGEADPNSFEPPQLVKPPVVKPPPDRTAPRTRLTRGPAKQVSTRRRFRRVVFAFASNEPGSSFRCRLDRRPYFPCRSPRAYAVRPGRHVFRVFAIDAAGNGDPSPTRFSFRVRRR